jgi:hypothetical protein
MQFSYELTLDEFKSALKLHSRQKLGRRIYFFIYDFVFPLAAVLALVATAYAYMHDGPGAIGGLIIFDVACIAAVALLFVVRRFRIRSAFRALYPAGSKNRVTSVVIGDEHILTSVEGVGEGRYLWSGVSAFVQNNLVALFYITDERFLMLPLGSLNPDQRNEISALVTRHVVGKRTC